MTIEQRREYQRELYRKKKDGEVIVYDGRSHPDNVEYHRALKLAHYHRNREELSEKNRQRYYTVKNIVAPPKMTLPTMCECGILLKRGSLESHMLTASHENRMFKKAVHNAKEDERKALGLKGQVRDSQYRCDRGIHRGKLLCHVVAFHPQYIDFLLRNHRGTFPLAFCEALTECGVDVDKYLEKSVEDTAGNIVGKKTENL